MSVVLLGGNRFVDCQSLLAYKGRSVLKVGFDPILLELDTPELPLLGAPVWVDGRRGSPADTVLVVDTARSFAVFWAEQHALAIATLLNVETAHLKLDLRALGIRIFDDFDGLHIGENTFSGNVVRQAAVAINLGD